ncbi:hypothetical protein ABIF81_002394 [Bradyrhizobium daqingense]
MTEHTQAERNDAPHIPIREATARLKVILQECAEDDDKRKHYFGYFRTSDGDL